VAPKPENINGIPLGPFVIEQVIGRGGMGEVWRGTHVAQGIPVAIKVLTAVGSTDPLFLSCFQNEVKASASLDHPTIIQVYDQGIITPEVEEETDGQLIAGSPYLAMQLAANGSLRALRGKLEWEQVWRILLRLLEGLAHAHARGLVHRDIKPSNILLMRKSGGIKLTDFGLAAAFEGGDEEHRITMGTPGYMAPEQVSGVERDIGPWSDLYALGCLAVALTTGRPPFYGLTPEETLNAQLYSPLPTLSHKCDVPDGFDEWISRLLEKNYLSRYTRAADAAWGLRQLVDESDRGLRLQLSPNQQMVSTVVSVDDEPSCASRIMTISNLSIPLSEHTQTKVIEKSGESNSPAPMAMPKLRPDAHVAFRPDRPPTPDSWRTSERPLRTPTLLGTGLGLFGMKFLPMVGREKEQDELWKELKLCIKNRRSRAVIISGTEGSGKSRLAIWLAQRSHEVGASSNIRGYFSNPQGSNFGLAPMLKRFLRAEGCDRETSKARVSSHMHSLGTTNTLEIDNITEVLGPFKNETSDYESRFSREVERFSAIRMFMEAQCKIRPMVMILDDAHLSEPALKFAEHILSSQERTPLPILMLITMSPEGVPPECRTSIRRLVKRTDVETLNIAALALEHRRHLVQEMLGLDADLAAMVEAKTGGNPHFAVQLVGEWVEKGLLMHGATGFSIPEGKLPPIPRSWESVWTRRLDEALEEIPDPKAAEVAAVLGVDIDHKEWRATCGLLDIVIPPLLLPKLMNHHLAKGNRFTGQWSFSHSLVKEALIAQARTTGDLKNIHLAASKALSNSASPHISTRLGRHLMAASEYEKAAESLLAGAKEHQHLGMSNQALAILKQREECLSTIGVDQQDERWLNGWIARANIHRSQKQQYFEAMALFSKVLENAPSSSAGNLCRAEAEIGITRISRMQGRYKEARMHAQRAALVASESPRLLARIKSMEGLTCMEMGLMEESRSLLTEARSLAAKCGDDITVNIVNMDLAQLYRSTGETEPARLMLIEAKKFFANMNRGLLVGRCANDLGEIARLDDRIDDAEAYYREALAINDSAGAESAFVVHMNLGIILAGRGHTTSAQEHVELANLEIIRLGLAGLHGCSYVIMALIAAHRKDWSGWDHALKRASDLLSESGFIDVDVARGAQKAAEEAINCGEIARAVDALRLSLFHWEQMEREVEAAIVLDLLNELSPDTTD
jgi:eukaryotic-like serine/threonine-protein kinase